MSDNDEKPAASVVAQAFGHIATTPRSRGRREPDQIRWWVDAIKTLGFPVVVAWYALTQLTPALDRLVVAQEKNTRAVVALLCLSDPQACVKFIETKP